MYNETGVCVGLFQQELINTKIKNKIKKKTVETIGKSVHKQQIYGLV